MSSKPKPTPPQKRPLDAPPASLSALSNKRQEPDPNPSVSTREIRLSSSLRPRSESCPRTGSEKSEEKEEEEEHFESPKPPDNEAGNRDDADDEEKLALIDKLYPNVSQPGCLIFLRDRREPKDPIIACFGRKVITHADGKVKIYKYVAPVVASHHEKELILVEAPALGSGDTFLLYTVLTTVRKMHLSDEVAFVAEDVSGHVADLLRTLRSLFGKSYLDCVLIVGESEGQPAEKRCRVDLKGRPETIPEQVLEAVRGQQLRGIQFRKLDELFARLREKVVREISRRNPKARYITAPIVSSVRFLLPGDPSVPTIPLIAGIGASGLGSYTMSAISPTVVPSTLFLSVAGMLYTVARAANYVFSSSTKTKGTIQASALARLHSPEIPGESVTFRSASVVPGSSRLTWMSLSSSFQATGCAIHNSKRDVLVQMRYWIDRYSLHSWMKGAPYGEFRLKCKNAYGHILGRQVEVHKEGGEHGRGRRSVPEYCQRRA